MASTEPVSFDTLYAYDGLYHLIQCSLPMHLISNSNSRYLYRVTNNPGAEIVGSYIPTHIMAIFCLGEFVVAEQLQSEGYDS